MTFTGLNESNEKGEIPWLPGFIGVDRRLTFGDDEKAADMASSEKSLVSNIRKL
jgi:hypothetical protein